MTEPFGYNDDQFEALPNEDASWQKMNQLLDKEEKKRRGLPFWLRFSALGILLLGAGIAGYMLLSKSTADPEGSIDRSQNEQKDLAASSKPATEKKNNNTPGNGSYTAGEYNSMPGDESVTPISPASETPQKSATANNSPHEKVAVTVAKKAVVNNNVHTPVSRKPKGSVSSPVISSVNPGKPQALVSIDADGGLPQKPSSTLLNSRDTGASDKIDRSTNRATPASDTFSLQKTQADPIADTTKKKPGPANPADTTKIKEAVADNKEKTRSRNPWKWSMGVSFQEPLAIGSQQSSDYNYMGKKSWMGDHLPGLYIAATKNKWSLSGQFNYRVPQPVEQVYFSQTTKYSPATTTLNTERYSVEKLYYHQFAATGSYFLHPRVSVESGGSYHLLAGAVTERNSTSVEVITGNTKAFTELAPVKGYKDSFLFRSTAGTLAGLTYHWKKVQLGIRYGYSLQPFMRYTKPDGTVDDVRNNTLMLTARLQVWNKGRR